MSQDQHEFTFIDVNAEKGKNSRKIRSHASTQINRQKRRRAVAQYQELLRQGSQKVEDSASPPPTATRAELVKSTPDLKPITAGGKSPSEHDAVTSRSEEAEDGQLDIALGGTRLTGIPSMEPWPTYRDWFVGYQIKRSGSSPSSSNVTGRAEKASPETLTVCLAPLPHRDLGLGSRSAEQQSMYASRIDSPTEYHDARWAPNAIRDFIQSSYESTWRDQWQDEDWYDDEDHELGVWRECFSLAVEFLQIGKVNESFSLINAGLSAAPRFLKANHPGLLVALLRIMSVCFGIKDQQLRSMILYHLVQLLVVTLKDSHPILLIIKGQFNEDKEPIYRDEVLASIVIDTIAEFFGTLHFIPVTMKFRMVYWLFEQGKIDEASRIVDVVADAWRQTQTPASPLMHAINIERARLKVARCTAPATELEHHVEVVTEQLESVRVSGLEMPRRKHEKTQQLDEKQLSLMSLASKQLILRAQHAILLHMHAHMNEMFDTDHATDPLDISDPDSLTFPTMVCRVMLRHLRDETA